LRKAKGNHLDQVYSDQKVLQVISGGRLVLVIRGQDSQTSSRDRQARVHSDKALVMARQEAGPHKQRLTKELHSHQLTQNTQMRVGKQLYVARELNQKEAE
jgi:hypothetical protein